MIEFFTANWLWIVLIVAFVAMHRGACGGHANHGNRSAAGRRAGGDRDEHAGHR